MDSFDKATCTQISNDIKSALASIAEKYGVDIKLEGGRFDSNQFHPKIGLYIGNKEDMYRKNWKPYCWHYGFKVEDLDRVAVLNGKEFKLTGLDPKKRKYSLRAVEVKTGRITCFPAHGVAEYLNKIEENTNGNN